MENESDRSAPARAWPLGEAEETAAELRALVSALSDVVLVIDRDGRYLKAWSRRPEELIRPPDVLVGRTFAEVLPPEFAAAALALVRRALDSGAPVEHEYPLAVQAGVRWFQAYIAPTGNDRVLWVARDVTERRQVFEALRESEERYRAAIELSPDAMIIHMAGGIAYVNQAGLERLGARRPEEILGRSVLDFVHPADRGAVGERIAAMRATGMPVPPTQFTFMRLDGSTAVGESAATPLTLGGEPAVLVVVRDLTERAEAEAALRDAEEALRQAQRMEAVGRLAGGIAHDFNNILTAIGGVAELMLDSISEDDPLGEDVRDIRGNVERASRLTRQLLAFSRKQIFRPSVVDLNAVLRNAERLLRRLIGEHIQLRLDLEAGLPLVRADAAQLEQVIVNLAVNARDAMPDGGRLTLATCARRMEGDELRHFAGMTPGPYVVICAEDTGAGIAPEVIPHIFEPFFTTKGRDAGTGLGLATVYGIVRQSGGWIGVDSTPGAGTKFEIFLPATAETEADVDGGPPQPTTGGNEVILLVEDEASVRRLTRRMLTRLGYQVLEAAHGEEALRLAHQHDGTIDLLLTDVVLPRESGRQVADRVRLERPGLAVLYMSGYTEHTISHHGVLNEGIAFVQKPFTGEQLAAAVRAALEQRARA